LYCQKITGDFLKGQIQQVFIYILTIIIVGLILLIGYRAIGGLMEKGCKVEMTTFKSNLESFITKYSSYGSFHEETMKAPCSFASICFVDTQDIEDGTDFPTAPEVIRQSVLDNIQENIFLFKTEVTEPAGFMSEIHVDDGMICINNSNGNFYIAFHGLGKKTNISSGG